MSLTSSAAATRTRLAQVTRNGSARGDGAFRLGTGTAAAGVVVLLAAVAVLLALESSEAWGTFSVLGFLTGVVWDPVRSIYGALPYLVGTLLSAAIALAIAAPIGVLTAIYLAEWAPRRVVAPLVFLVELLAAIPSVVIGLWGVFILGPALRATVGALLTSALGWVPFLAGPSLSTGLIVAGVILAIMILPTIVSISREVITTVPQSQREAVLALGATRWEAVRMVVLPAARNGIVGAVILGLGRALGETMAVTMVIGNGQDIPTSLFSQANTIASKIATTFNEAQVGIQTSSLVALGLILLAVTIVLNVAARLLVRRVQEAGR